ncbi:sugar transporter [Ranunculus cassubicifolius]
MDSSVSIRVPYRNLRESEVELVGFDNHNDDSHHRIELNSRNAIGNNKDLDSSPPSSRSNNEIDPISTKALVLSCMVAAGVQFGWALQLSLLTPYIQTLGIQHAFSSFIWLCGPITGLVVQPCVGIWSDRCYSKYGRRRPYILLGSLLISIAVIIIGFSADIGYILGDSKESCSTYRGTRVRAAVVFVIGFWMLDLANNTVQGPARALLADLAGPHQRNSANAIFCSWMAVGNILGFSSGASGKWLKWFPFLRTKACCEACGNLKGAFLVAVVFLTFCTLVTLYFAKEIPLAKPVHMSSDSAPLLNDTKQSGIGHKPTANGVVGNESPNQNSERKEDQIEEFNNSPGAVLVNLLTSMRHLPPSMHSVLIVMALSWLSWFPFFLFDTDWMGREVYNGDPNGNAIEIKSYNEGVREGAFGLLLNSVVLGVSSFLIEPMCKRMGSRLVWALSNFTVFACMAMIAIISMFSVRDYSEGIQDVYDGSKAVRYSALVVFSLLGFPLAITYSVPFSVTAELTADSGGGQGLAIGVLNLAIVVPQMIVSLGAGPWDALFGGGNVPAFALASIFALVGGIVAKLKLPNLASNFQSSGFHFG